MCDVRWTRFLCRWRQKWVVRVTWAAYRAQSRIPPLWSLLAPRSCYGSCEPDRYTALTRPSYHHSQQFITIIITMSSSHHCDVDSRVSIKKKERSVHPRSEVAQESLCTVFFWGGRGSKFKALVYSVESNLPLFDSFSIVLGKVHIRKSEIETGVDEDCWYTGHERRMVAEGKHA